MHVNSSILKSVSCEIFSRAIYSSKAYFAAAFEALHSLGQLFISSCKSLYGRVVLRQQVSSPPEGPYSSLPDDPLVKIADLVGAQTARISKRFAGLNEKAQEGRWREIEKEALTDDFLSILAQEAKSCPRFNAKMCFIFQKLEKTASFFGNSSTIMLQQSRRYGLDSLERLRYIRGWIKDQNFFRLFSEIARFLPQAQQFLGLLAGLEEREKANQLREWMQNNQDLLLSVVELKFYQALTEIPKEISLCGGLLTLRLSRMKLRKLPDWMGQLKSLQSLRLFNNDLQEIPESIGQLENLRELDLGINQLTKLPESVTKLKNLQNLDLFSNELEVPESIGQLKSLRQLNLGNTRRVKIPESIGQLENLEELDLSTNWLNKIPESIGRLANLRKLKLDCNDLEVLPTGISRLRNLQELDLTCSFMRKVSDEIGQLENLQTLSLRNNGLTDIPSSLGQLRNLQKLDLGQNHILSSSPNLRHVKATLVNCNIILDENPIPASDRIRRIILLALNQLEEYGARVAGGFRDLLGRVCAVFPSRQPQGQ